MYQKKLVEGFILDEYKDFSMCEACIFGKYKRVSFSTDFLIRVTVFFGLVYSDFCGFLLKFLGGKEYFFTFIDDYIRFCVVYFLFYKSDIFGCFLEYVIWAEL